ncbi:Nuclear pore complex protein Nup98-Nup96 [Nowakowskiella sp. JEL0407]|nr:Nuclear pore complex protein Nup98-Nup96 [Nowakowskiella sp. JEL0407]
MPGEETRPKRSTRRKSKYGLDEDQIEGLSFDQSPIPHKPPTSKKQSTPFPRSSFAATSRSNLISPNSPSPSGNGTKTAPASTKSVHFKEILEDYPEEEEEDEPEEYGESDYYEGDSYYNQVSSYSGGYYEDEEEYDNSAEVSFLQMRHNRKKRVSDLRKTTDWNSVNADFLKKPKPQESTSLLKSTSAEPAQPMKFVNNGADDERLEEEDGGNNILDVDQAESDDQQVISEEEEDPSSIEDRENILPDSTSSPSEIEAPLVSVPPTPTNLLPSYSDEPRKVQAMRASFFSSTPKPTPRTINRYAPFTSSKLRPAPSPPKSISPRRKFGYDEMETDEVEEESESAIEAEDQSVSEAEKESVIEENPPELPFPKKVEVPVVRSVPFEKSLMYGRQKSALADAGLFMGKSFRVGWGPGGTFITLSNSAQQNVASDSVPNGVKIRKINVFGEISIEEEKIKHTAMLSEILKHSKITNTSNTNANVDDSKETANVPSVSIQYPCKLELSIFAKAIPSDAHIWSLASALWDDYHILSSKPSETVKSAYRREMLSAWLISNCNSKDTSLFGLLTARKIAESIKLAIKTGNLKLATLISQISGPGAKVALRKPSSGHGISGCGGIDEITRDLIEKQVAVWEKECAGFIAPEILHVYQLLAGRNWSLDFWNRLLKGSDWKSVFAVVFWYADGGWYGVSQAVESFQKLLDSRRFKIPAPVPNHSVNSSGTTFDICYLLLKLDASFQTNSIGEVSLETVLNPLGISQNVLDYRVSFGLWIGLSVLKKVKSFRGGQSQSSMDVDEIEGDHSERLISAMIMQLELIGLWQWAVYVALWINDMDAREKTVKELLSKWYQISDASGSCWNTVVYGKSSNEVSETWKFLVDELKIPNIWIHEAKALAARYQGKLLEEAVFLIDAKQFALAHQRIISRLIPNCVISGNHKIIKSLLKQIPSCEILELNYNICAGLFIEYFTLVDEIPNLLSSPSIQSPVSTPGSTSSFGKRSHETTGNSADLEKAIEKLRAVLEILRSNETVKYAEQLKLPMNEKEKVAMKVAVSCMIEKVVGLTRDCEEVLEEINGESKLNHVEIFAQVPVSNEQRLREILKVSANWWG